VRACPDVELRLPSGMAVQRHAAEGHARHALRHIATRSRARRSVKSGGSSEIAQKASRVVHRLATSCGQPRSPDGLVPFGLLVDEASAESRQSRKRGRFSDGRHLGRSRPRSSSRKGGRGGPRPRMTPRKRVVQGPRVPTLRGGGARAVGSSSNAGVFSRRGNGLTTRGVRADRVGVLPAHGRPQGRAEGAPGP